MEILEPGRRNIVVLGAGFGGITALLKIHSLLENYGLLRQYNLVLVNNADYHLYTPALYEIASIPREDAAAIRLKSAFTIPIDDIIGPYPDIRFIGEEATKLDPRNHIITFKSGNRLNFEYAVIALGAETNYFSIPGLKEHSYPIKKFEDAVRLRNKVEELIKSSAGLLRIVICGAGATGVELSSEFVNFFGCLKKELKSACRSEIILIEAGPEILAGFSPSVIRRAKRRLGKLGIKVLTSTMVKKVTTSAITIEGGKSFSYHLLIWSGGIAPPEVLKNFGLPLDKKGGIAVNEFLEAKSRIYAIGDCATFINPKTQKTLPRNVPVAEAEARLAAKNIIASIRGQRPQKFAPMARYPFILAVGGKYAVTDLVFVKFFSWLGWALKQLVELNYLVFILPWGKAVKTWLKTVRYSTTND